ncbi:MAG TPA: twin-arginine translocase subunit TatC [bacterium]|nr:twin-arginine translocase subunit TatC [bacterium]
MERNNSSSSGAIEHIEELRKRIILGLSGWIFLSACAYFFSDSILEYLVQPLQKYQDKPFFTRPIEPFMSILKVSVLSGALLNLPNMLFQIWAFISPALVTKKERRSFGIVIWGFPLFFAAGASFSFYVIVPFGLRFLFSFGRDIMSPLISIGSYLNFLFVFIVALGFVFNLPVVASGLASAGMVNASMLRGKRKYAFLLSFIVAAIITPPDVISQILVAIPLVLLYEISIIMCSFFKN